MKRQCPIPRNIVRLNVGGQLFQTSRETLSRSAFLTSLLEFDGGDQDGDGNIFVDRAPHLFKILLECWRTSLRPPQRTISQFQDQLLAECKFFAADDAAARIAGKTSEADLSPQCRLIALDEAEGSATLVNVFNAHLELKDIAQLQLPPLLLAPVRSDSSVLAGDFSHCKECLNVQMGGILVRLLEDSLISQSVVIAGGAVVGALTGCASGDVDLFLVGAPAGEEHAILAKIYSIVMDACKEHRGDAARLLVTRSSATMTLFKQHHGPPIQIVLSTYSTLEDLLIGFDIDCAACAFVLRTGVFVCSRRARRALEYRVNLMQSSRNLAAYAQRLEKYAARGFAVGLPGLDMGLLSPDLLSALYVRTTKHDLLLRILSGECSPGSSSVRMPAGANKTSEVRCRKQIARRVSGIQRLVVLSFSKHVREVDSPCVGLASKNSRTVDARRLDGVVVLHSEERRDEFHLLWGLACTSSDDEDFDDSDEDDDGQGYSMTPVAKAVVLFDSCLKKQTASRAHEERVDEDWMLGGVIPRVAKTMHSNERTAKHLVEARVYSQLSRHEKVSFVYDFCDAERSFDSLNFVRNAAQKPLRPLSDKMPPEAFVALYGLSPTLCFTAAVRRPPSEQDWWSALYGSQYGTQ